MANQLIFTTQTGNIFDKSGIGLCLDKYKLEFGRKIKHLVIPKELEPQKDYLMKLFKSEYVQKVSVAPIRKDMIKISDDLIGV